MSAVEANEARRQRGLAIAALCKIVQQNGQWVVPSQTGNGSYRVNLKPAPFVPQCTCPDYAERGAPCKHVYAVQFTMERERHADGTETTTRTITVKETCAKRPTYRQNWAAYNKSQTTEKHRFQVLLADLCKGVPPTPPRKGRGQQPLCMADMVFAATFKVFSTVSGRRFACDLADAHAKGYIAKAPHFNSVLNYLRTPELTPIFRALIAESAAPLKSVETGFAIDSSGFTTSRFVRWVDAKYGQPKQEYDWVKVHLMTGVKTNIVTAVEIGERYAGDSPQFIPLVNTTAQRGFKIGDVTADAAYSSYDNMERVGQLGGTPYIAYRANASGQHGGLYGKMFHFYNLHRDDFLKHYHQRSNVETTFSMVKAKFGDHLRSKTDTGMVNEALAKVLCHNIAVLIQSHNELGIVADFWGKDTAAAAAEKAKAESDVDQLIAMYEWM